LGYKKGGCPLWVAAKKKRKNMATGTIAKMIEDKGFGFIKPDEGDKDLFFHARSVVGTIIFDDLREGDKVNYETEEGPKGLAAVGVEKTAADTPAVEEAPVAA